MSGRCAASSIKAFPKGATRVRWPSLAIEAIIAEVVKQTIAATMAEQKPKAKKVKYQYDSAGQITGGELED